MSFELQICLFLCNDDTFDKVTGSDEVDNIQSFDHFAETGMDAIKVLGVLAVMADEELATAGVFACMCHGEDTTVVVLFIGMGLAFDCPSGATSTHTGITGIAAIGASALDNEIGNYAMEAESVVEAVLGQFDEVGDCCRNFFFIEFRFHGTLGCVDYCVHIPVFIYSQLT